MSSKNSDYYFLKGGGEMGKLIRAKDWSKTSLGDPADWPQSLRTMVAVMLDNPFGMYIAWGSEYTQLYNDGYRPILGASKHPHALGISTRETFLEIWHIIESMFGGVMEGKAVGFPDLMLPLNRNGFIEECYFDFAYSPIRKDNGEVGGVLVTVIETTEKKRATEALKESNARFINNIMQAPVAMCIFRGGNYVVDIANEQMLHLWGKHADEVMNKPIFEGLPEAKNQGLEPLLDSVFTTGEKFIANERPVNLLRSGKIESTYINFVYEALKEPDGTITGIVAIATDVTSQVLARKTIEESDERLRSLIKNAPFPIGVYAGKEMRIEVANESIIKAWGKGNNVTGKLFNELMPELVSQKIFEQLDDVFNTGNPFHAYNQYLTLVVDGQEQPYYYNYSFTPIFDSSGKVYGVMNTASDVTDLNLAKKKIEESDKRFRNIMKQAPVGITILRGPEYIVEMANDAYLQLVDKKESEFVGNSLFATLPEVKEVVHPLLDSVLKTGLPYHGNEVPMPVNRYGKQDVFYFDFMYHPLKEEDGKISGIIVAVTEVTEKVETRKKIEERKRLYEVVTQNTPDLIYVFDLNYRFTYANEALLNMWGIKWDDANGKGMLELGYEPWHAEMHEREIEKVIKTKKPIRGEVSFSHATLGNRIYDYIFAPVIDQNGKVEAITGTTRDITEQVEARKKIEESESNLKLMIHQAPVSIGILRGLDYTVEIVNKHALELWGRTEQQVLGKPIFNIMPELLTQGIKELLDDVRSTGKRFATAEMPVQLVRQGIMETVYVNFSYEPLYDADEKINGIMAVGMDVTHQAVARKKIEDSEKRYNLMLMQSPFAFLILKGKDLVVHLANESMKEVLGKGSDIEGKPLLEVLPELKGQAFPDLLDNVYNTGISFSANEMLAKLTRNGKLEDVYFNYVYQPYYEADNTILGVTVIAYDVTSSVIANKKIEASEERLKIVVEASELGTYELNLKTKEPNYSKRYLEILGGYKEDIQLTHAQLLQHLHPDDFPIREKAFKEAIITGYLHYEARLIWNDKSIHWMEGKGKVFYDEENKPEKLIGTIRDITEEKNHEQELKESEEQFSTLADNMENLAWLADGEGWIYWYNKRWLEYTGLSLEEMQGWGWQKVHHPDHVERIVEITKKIWHINESFELTFPLRRHDGEYRWFLTRGYPVTNEEGKITRWIGTNTDIDEQKKAEEKFKMLADQAPMWVWLTDKEVNIQYTNPEMLQFLGIAHYTEFTGHLWEQKVHSEDIAIVYKSFGEATSLQQSFSFEFRVLNASNQQYEWFYIKAVPRLEAGEFAGFIGTGININEQKTFTKELEEQVIARTAELKASEEKFYNLFNLSPISKTLSDTSSGKIVMVNDAFTKLFGYSRENALGKSSAELGLLDLEEREIIINELKTNGKIENREIWFIKKSGEKFIALASAELISIGDKQFFLSAFNDISEIKKAEQNIKQKNIELEKMNKELQSFAYISSHDLQEPLRKIQTFASRIKEKEENNLSDSGKDMFNRMHDSAKRMQTLIQDLLAYSRTETQELKFKNTDLNEIITEVKEDLEEELKEKHATIESNQLCNADIIPFQFRQLMHNLIGNSLKFSNSENPPHVQIKSEIANGIKFKNEKLSPQKKYCHISVSDNGIGFEQQYSEKIFEVFQRLHGKNEYNGTGIGLSIVKKIVENHHGIITASSELNKGATFDIYIPAT